MEDNFSNVERRVQRYWYTDGIGELIGGGMFILLGLYFALQEFLGQESIVGGILQASLVLLMIVGTFVSRKLVSALKTRLTYPRTGYVEYSVNERSLRWSGMFAALLAVAVSALTVVFARTFRFLASMVAVTGVVVGLILVVLRAKSAGLARFYVLGAASLVLGLAFSISGLPNGYSLGLFYGLMGVCFIISGGLTLRRYLKENPLPAETDNE